VQLGQQELLAADPVLAVLDPDLDSVLNINEPAGYRTARARPAPEITIRRFGTLAAGKPAIEMIRAATVARAAAVAGLVIDGELAVALNGDLIEPDGHTPLVTGDMVYFVR
jgi:molybdenum cofactor guanylyltransferase